MSRNNFGLGRNTKTNKVLLILPLTFGEYQKNFQNVNFQLTDIKMDENIQKDDE